MSLNFYDQIKELFSTWRESLPGGVHFLTLAGGKVILRWKSDTTESEIAFEQDAIQYGDAAEFGRVAVAAMMNYQRSTERTMKLTAMAVERQAKMEAEKLKVHQASNASEGEHMKANVEKEAETLRLERALKDGDARVWAVEFMASIKKSYQQTFEEFMRGWFANAIVCGYHKRCREVETTKLAKGGVLSAGSSGLMGEGPAGAADRRDTPVGRIVQAEAARGVIPAGAEERHFRFVAKPTGYGAEVHDYKLEPRPVLMAQFPGLPEEALARARVYAAYLTQLAESGMLQE